MKAINKYKNGKINKQSNAFYSGLKCAMNLLQAVILLVVGIYTSAQPAGWKMTDRFNGFRYEVSLSVNSVGFLDLVVQQANDFGCFGWVQQSSNDDLTFVGEARCNKSKGPKFQDWFRHVNNLKVATIKVNMFVLVIFNFPINVYLIRNMKVPKLDYILLSLKYWIELEILVLLIPLINARTLRVIRLKKTPRHITILTTALKLPLQMNYNVMTKHVYLYKLSLFSKYYVQY